MVGDIIADSRATSPGIRTAEITCRFRPKSGAGLLRFLQGDDRRNAPQRARCADSGRSQDHDRAAGIDPKLPLGSGNALD
jgi:hypothetical protein